MVFLSLAVEVCLHHDRFITQAQAPPVRVALTVASAALPVTLGVPLGEIAAVTDVTQLGVIDANGAPVPSQLRVLARWRGLATDTAKPLKWVLVDFKPAAAGVFYLTRAPQTVPSASALVRNETATSIRVTNSQLDIELPKSGGDLVRSFKLGGTEQLRASLTAQAEVPRAVVVNRIDKTINQFTVADATIFRVGETVRFEKIDFTKWDADAGSARLIMWQNEWQTGHRYRIEEGTARVEEFVVGSVPGTQDLRLAAPLRFKHPMGSKVRDLTVETETATVRSVRNQDVQFTAALGVTHTVGEKVIATTTALSTANLSVDSARIEEANALRTVVRQDGRFVVSGARVLPVLSFTLRYYVYADQPFVRVRLQLTNTGSYGWAGINLGKGTFAQHALLRSLSVLTPTVGAGSGTVQVLTAADAHNRLAQNQTGATLAAGSGNNLLEISVPEFTENFPKALVGDASGLRFNVLPNLGDDYVFDGARAKTTDFYLGRSTAQGRALTNSLMAKLDPAYLASTGAVRPALIEKRNWASVITQNAETGQAGNRYEQLMASAYDLAACNAAKPQSIFEYRQSTEFGENLGWRNFGDLAWGDGYSNLHYDLPFTTLREFVRTGDSRAFQIGSELARYRADWGHYHGDDFLDSDLTWNVKGMAFYEKGDHGSFLEPKPSHTWIEGMWLFWALTGDEIVHESALSGSEAAQRMNFNFDNALSWNEPRWLGWPVLSLMAAWRYTGDMRYLAKARDNCYLFAQTEESFGRKGYYISQTVDWSVKAVQPWAWLGYAQQGVIEFWRETNDQRIAAYLVRIADWYIGKGMTNPPLRGGTTLANGTYLPLGTSYFWTPNAVADDLTLHSGGMGLQVLTAAARISGRQDLWDKSRQLFRDVAFYRDTPDGTNVAPGYRATISFRSAQFTGSSTKAFGQTALTINDFLPELLNAVVLPRTPVVIPPPQPTPSPSPGGGGGTPTPTPTPDPNGIPPELPPPNTSGLINAAYRRPASASSTRGMNGVTGDAASANDGLIRNGSLTSAWQSASNTGQQEWWQVDLGAALRLQAFEITFRPDKDEPNCRRNFLVLGSNDASFTTSVALAGHGSTAVPFGQVWRVGVGDTTKYRYIRVRKTITNDADATGQVFFNLTEFKAFAVPVPPLAAAFPNTATLTNVALNKPASASSVRVWPDVTGDPASGNDGLVNLNGKVSLWHSQSNTNQPEWWQVDLGMAYRLAGVELVFRPDLDQVNCRRNFMVLGSSTPEFDNPTVLAMREGDAVPFGQTWRWGVADTGSYRYVRVQKTDWNDRDSAGEYYFNVTELRLFADTNALRPLALSELTPKRLLVGQALSFLLKKTDDQGRPVTLAVTGMPEGATFDAARGLFSYTPTATQAGKLFAPMFAASGAQLRMAKQEIVVTLDGAPNIVLTAPAAGTQLIAGQYATIAWATDPGARVAKFQVKLSVDGGATYSMLLAEMPGTVGQYRWLIPSNFPSSAFVRFMVTATDTSNRVGLDYSKQDFRVSATP